MFFAGSLAADTNTRCRCRFVKTAIPSPCTAYVLAIIADFNSTEIATTARATKR